MRSQSFDSCLPFAVASIGSEVRVIGIRVAQLEWLRLLSLRFVIAQVGRLESNSLIQSAALISRLLKQPHRAGEVGPIVHNTVDTDGAGTGRRCERGYNRARSRDRLRRRRK